MNNGIIIEAKENRRTMLGSYLASTKKKRMKSPPTLVQVELSTPTITTTGSTVSGQNTPINTHPSVTTPIDALCTSTAATSITSTNTNDSCNLITNHLNLDGLSQDNSNNRNDNVIAVNTTAITIAILPTNNGNTTISITSSTTNNNPTTVYESYRGVHVVLVHIVCQMVF